MITRTLKAKTGIAGLRIVRDSDAVFRAWLFDDAKTRIQIAFMHSLLWFGGAGFLLGALLGSSGGSPLQLGAFVAALIGIPAAIIGAVKALIMPGGGGRNRLEITNKTLRFNGKRFALKDVGAFRANETVLGFDYGRDFRCLHARKGQDFQSMYDLRTLLNDRRAKFLSLEEAHTEPAPGSASLMEERALARSAEL